MGGEPASHRKPRRFPTGAACTGRELAAPRDGFLAGLCADTRFMMIRGGVIECIAEALLSERMRRLLLSLKTAGAAAL